MAGNKKSKRISANTHPKGINGKRPCLSVVVNVTREEIEEQSRKMKLIPLVSLEKFRSNTATMWDWRTIEFRCFVGHEIAKALYTEEAIGGLQAALDMITIIRARIIGMQDGTLGASAEEVDIIRMALEATDEMQDELNSKDQLDFYRKAEKIIAGTKP